MPADTAHHDFLHYLVCDLPLGYPLKTSITKLLDLSLKSTRRELLHRQDSFLEFAKQYLDAHPWIAYLAALKHEAVLVTIPTYAAQLVDIVDQLFFAELQQKYKELRVAARERIDETTAFTCERLILLQSEAPQIEHALKSVKGALAAGFTTLEPLPPPPPEPVADQHILSYFITAGVVSLLAGSFVPLEYGGMAWAFLGLVIIGLIARRVMGKEQARVKTEGGRFGGYVIHESYYTLVKKSVSLVLALPFEIRKSALTDLASCQPALEALLPEREALEVAYITPFFP